MSWPFFNLYIFNTIFLFWKHFLLFLLKIYFYLAYHLYMFSKVCFFHFIIFKYGFWIELNELFLVAPHLFLSLGIEFCWQLLFCVFFISFFSLLLTPRTYRASLLYIALFGSLFLFSITVCLLCLFYNQLSIDPLFTFSWSIPWFPLFPLTFYVDSISISLILLTTFLFPFCFIHSGFHIQYRFKELLLLLYIIEFFLILIFSLSDIFFFYIAFESTLIPMFLLIGIWGSRNRRVHAAYQFLFYTAIGSFFMLLGLIYIYTQVHSFNWQLVQSFNFSILEERLLWWCFFLAFAVKIPIFPFHIWLPEAHTEAPTVGSVLLAGILLKVGTYGILRFVIGLFSHATLYFTPFVQMLCIVGLFYTSLTTLRQVDLKKIIAYASIGHMSYVVLGLFSLTTIGISGSIFLMIGHGIVSSALFFLIGSLYDRYQTRLIPAYSGLTLIMPRFAFFLFIFTLGNVSFPGSINFIGEFLCIAGTFTGNWFCGVCAAFAIIFTAAYSFWLLNRVCFGPLLLPCEPSLDFSVDLMLHERFIFWTLSIVTLWFGLQPNLFLVLFETPVSLLLWQAF